MITINKLSVEEKPREDGLFGTGGQAVRVTCDIDIDGAKHPMWIEIDARHRDWIVTERCDGFLVGVLHFAMTRGHDITSHLPVSEELLFQIETDLLPAIHKNRIWPHLPKLDVPRISTPVTKTTDTGFATGCSCGVDSLHVLQKFRDYDYRNLDPKYLVLANIGDFGAFNEFAMTLFRAKVKRFRAFAQSVGKDLIPVDTNFEEFWMIDHFSNVIFGISAYVLTLQRGLNGYHLASGYDYCQFSVDAQKASHDCPRFELLLLKTFSSHNLTFFLDGASVGRKEKVQALLRGNLAENWISVCGFHLDNCGFCKKCQRTILEIVSCGGMAALDRFEKVFDVKAIKRNFHRHLAFFIVYWFKGDVYMHEMKDMWRYVRPQSFFWIPWLAWKKIAYKRYVRAMERSGRSWWDEEMKVLKRYLGETE